MNVELIYEACEKGNINLLREFLHVCAKFIDVNARFTDDGNTMLHLCCASGQLECVKMLLNEYNANMYEENKDLNTSYEVACRAGQLEIVQFFMDTISELPYRNKTPLEHAMWTNKMNIVEYLLSTSRGKCWMNRCPPQDVIFACDKHMFELFLRRGYYVNAQIPFSEYSLLHYCCIDWPDVLKDRDEKIRLLLEYGARYDPTAKYFYVLEPFIKEMENQKYIK